MARGEHRLERLNHKEYKAALAAVKLVRGDKVKNAFIEGFLAGWEQSNNNYYNRRMKDENESWEESHAKYLRDKETQ